MMDLSIKSDGNDEKSPKSLVISSSPSVASPSSPKSEEEDETEKNSPNFESVVPIETPSSSISTDGVLNQFFNENFPNVPMPSMSSGSSGSNLNPISNVLSQTVLGSTSNQPMMGDGQSSSSWNGPFPFLPGYNTSQNPAAYFFPGNSLVKYGGGGGGGGNALLSEASSKSMATAGAGFSIASVPHSSTPVTRDSESDSNSEVFANRRRQVRLVISEH